ncbi:hypothetical protein HZA39_03225, partial [Candidatus Peregrinibacteria bacterium]|nr:hypothetical protein [Candidatus Peregrinibacteria bacterium]
MENAALNCAKIENKNQTVAMNAAAQNTAEKILEKSLHEKFVLYGKNAREWARKCALLLPEIAKHRIWEKKGFENIYEYARILAGMSTNAVNDALWIGRKIENKPALRRVAEEKGANAIKPVVSLATPENESFWAEKANGMSVHTLETYVKEFKKLHMEANDQKDFLHVEKNYYENQNLFSDIKTEQIIMDLEPEIADQFKKLKGNGNWNDLAKKLLTAYQTQLEA